MEIKTAFDVHNLVKRKFDTNAEDGFSCFEVMEVSSQTCYAGTQVFYNVRQVICHKKFGEWKIAHGVNRNEDGRLGWLKYREDELIPASQAEIDFITGATKEPIIQ